MIDTTIAYSGHKQEAGRVERVRRAQRLFEERADEFKYLGEGVYLVPSQNGHAAS